MDKGNVLESLESNIRLLEKEVEKVGTRRDDEALRCKVRELIGETTQTVERSRDGFLGAGKRDKDFKFLESELRRLSAVFRVREGQNPLKINTETAVASTTMNSSKNLENQVALADETTERTPLLHTNTQQQHMHLQDQMEQGLINDDELDFHTIVQEDRSRQISRIHSSVQEVNAIFKQLGTLVREQGTQVDTVDENIANFDNNMHRANEQLNRADEHQRQRNRCGLMTLIIIIVVVIIILGASS
ncbi:uncharacterized protein GVI51_G04609 [Nakaseomyces glabratus]|uniref:t-SNARE coiled-coil homology domain-containing protein n=1 Tax=Candida glabrata (strain ATCC 2001 / BCRC 20586 / JCM 3761 / NBRC 0622 / NRRL Y-65 / CBS 138) TaxID=284593 RepID=Q6FT75_CANGA|nr:uncharacterized protein CAGL0G04807g [Nakaseomyces glabratus]KAH7603321.1 t-SNARE coiled-coil homology domain profile [Nakaseomyces glabratus]KAH7606844.1 t-SNARE coiled-coil homology domain profile [Nakaseomyces glabratus]QHS66201.1 uncharacterized protein GVI51_G04609 [Nakaseomyces glabratus]CAG59496.1 unnamed protein product [Nakaseomyces glabratus]|eukprot:XP_446569.1 uncharacterized protein CAGL0G04807g [[Candida] glabrata]